MVEIIGETSYRSGKEVIKKTKPEEYGTIQRLLNGGFEIDTALLNPQRAAEFADT